MKKHIPTNESGRSMVEMLGVLAIMGVLSIGAVAGYRWAMDKYEANEIVNEVKKRAVIASQQRILNRPLDLSEFDNFIQDKYPVMTSDNYNGNNFVFTLSVEGIEKGVCEKVLNVDWALPIFIDLNGVELAETSVCGETNTILYAFNNDLRTETIAQPGEGSDDEKDDGCPSGEYLDLATGECVKSSCPDGQFLLGSGNCVACPTASNPSVSMQSSLDDNSCTVCDGGRLSSLGSYGDDYACIYCPKPRVVCSNQCCAEGQACQATGNSWPPVYTCVTAQCQSDADCADPTPLCDTFTGTCFAGCHDNSDCGSNQYCLLDTTSTGRSCTQKPERGTCQPATTRPVGEYTASTTYMNWWSANNFCEALHMSLADLLAKCTSDELEQLDNRNTTCQALSQFQPGYDSWIGGENFGNCAGIGISQFTLGYVFTNPKGMTLGALCQ